MREEDSLQFTVADYLSKALTAESFFTHIPNEVPAGNMKKGMKTWRYKLKKKGTIAGVPDILIIHSGRALFIELKSWKGVLSRNQRGTIPKIQRAGAHVSICRDLDQVIAFLEAEEIPLRWKPLTLGGKGAASTSSQT